MSAMTSAGTMLSIASGLPATYDEAGYAALSYTEIGEITDIGEFGPAYAVVEHKPLRTRRIRKLKSSVNDGSLNVQMARAPSDDGQIVLRVALAQDTSRAVELVLQDGSILYFSADVSSFTTSVGSVDQVTAATVMFEVNTQLVEVEAPGDPGTFALDFSDPLNSGYLALLEDI